MREELDNAPAPVAVVVLNIECLAMVVAEVVCKEEGAAKAMCRRVGVESEQVVAATSAVGRLGLGSGMEEMVGMGIVGSRPVVV